MGVVLRFDLFSDSVHVHGLGIVQRNMKLYVNIIFLISTKIWRNDLNFSIWWLHTQSKTGEGWDSLFEICFIFQVKSCKSFKYKTDVISSAGKMNVTQDGCRNASQISYCQLARSSFLNFFINSGCEEINV